MMDKETNIIIQPDQTKLEQQLKVDYKEMPSNLIEKEGNSILNRSSMMTYSKIVCCLCGASIDANPRGICRVCDQKNIDITEGIPRNISIEYCKLCDRYSRPPWMRCKLESPDMMTLCLSKIKHLTKAKIIDSSFIWTEPHSKQIKVKLSIQKEIDNALVTTSFIIDYKVDWVQCNDCKKTFTPHQWSASVQIRQKVKNKITFLYLEQLVLKHKMHLNALNIKEQPEGVDFYFLSKNDAIPFTEFINGLFPCKVSHTKQIISANEKWNHMTRKLSYMIEIAPLCKDEVIILSDKESKAFGGIGPIVLCEKLSSKIDLVDPLTFKKVQIDGHTYWKYGFKSYIDRLCLREFLVMSCEEEIDYKKYSHHHSKRQGQDQEERQNPNEISSSIPSHNLSNSTNYCLNASQSLIIATNEQHIKIVKCIRNFPSDNTDIIEVKTHIGDKIQAGDILLGYDLNYINLNEANEVLLRGRENTIPDVILVKKKAPSSITSKKLKLKHLNIEKEKDENKKRKKDKENEDEEYEQFLNDIKEDKEMIDNIDLEQKDNEDVKESETKKKEQPNKEPKQNLLCEDNDEEIGKPQKQPKVKEEDSKEEKKTKKTKKDKAMKKKKVKKQSQLEEDDS